MGWTGALFQEFTKLGCEGGRIEWLVDKSDTFIQHTMMDDGVWGVTGHVEHLCIREPAADSFGDIPASKLRHDDIGEKNVETLRRCTGIIYFLNVDSLHHFVPEGAEHGRYSLLFFLQTNRAGK